jgi:selenocysteine-specific elongation factor
VEAVAVSGATGQGVDELRAALDRLVSRLPAPDRTAPVRLWVDRAFTVRGSGTVVTGTLAAGTLRVGDTVELRGRTVRVRGLQSLGTPYDEVAAVARVAVNLRGVERDEVDRGDAVLTPGSWRPATTLDVRLGVDPRPLPAELVLHVGSTVVAVRVRPLGDDTARLQLRTPLPLRAGDRALLRDPGAQTVVSGVLLLDADPPELRRRGAAVLRGSALAEVSGVPDLHAEVARRGAVRRAELTALGVPLEDLSAVLAVGDWLVDPGQWQDWATQLASVVEASVASAPLEGGPTAEAARQAVGLPDLRLLPALVAAAGLESSGGRVRRPGAATGLERRSLGRRAGGRLTQGSLRRPGGRRPGRAAAGTAELAAAERAGRLLRLPGDVVLLPDGPRGRCGCWPRCPSRSR